MSGSGTYVGGGNHHFEYAYDVPTPSSPRGGRFTGGDHTITDYVRFSYCKYDPNTGQETQCGFLDNAQDHDVVHIDPDPYGNKYCSILVAEIPPLKPIAGTGYYTVRVFQQDAAGGGYKNSDPHYIYVH